MKEKDLLYIRKWSGGGTDGMLPLKITKELHAQVKDIAEEANQPLSKIACQLVAFALDRVKIIEEGEE